MQFHPWPNGPPAARGEEFISCGYILNITRLPRPKRETRPRLDGGGWMAMAGDIVSVVALASLARRTGRCHFRKLWRRGWLWSITITAVRHTCKCSFVCVYFMVMQSDCINIIPEGTNERTNNDGRQTHKMVDARGFVIVFPSTARWGAHSHAIHPSTSTPCPAAANEAPWLSNS